MKVEKMMAMNVIGAAPAKWGALIVFPAKKDESQRLAVDLNKLNCPCFW